MNFKYLRILCLFIFMANLPLQAHWWQVSEDQYHIPAILAGITTIITTNWIMGKVVDNNIENTFNQTQNALDENNKSLTAAHRVLTSPWEDQLSQDYSKLDYTKKHVFKPFIDTLNIPPIMNQPNIKIGNPGIMGTGLFQNLSNLLGNRVIIKPTHKHAHTFTNLLDEINKYNEQHKKNSLLGKRYYNFLNLHRTFQRLYGNHYASINAFKQYNNPVQSQSNYSDFHQHQSNLTQRPQDHSPILPAHIERQLINEATNSTGEQLYYNTGRILDSTINDVQAAINTIQESNLICSKINEITIHLQKMNYCLKSGLNYDKEQQQYHAYKNIQEKQKLEQDQFNAHINLEKQKLALQKEKQDAEYHIQQQKISLETQKTQAELNLAQAQIDLVRALKTQTTTDNLNKLVSILITSKNHNNN